MFKMAYYKINSRLNAPTGCNYRKDSGRKSPKGGIVWDSIRVMIPGKYRPDDFTKEGEELPFICINDREYKGLMEPGHKDSDSPFSILKKEGKLFVIIIKFSEMPAKFQEKYNPDEHNRLQEIKRAAIEADKLKRRQEAEDPELEAAINEIDEEA